MLSMRTAWFVRAGSWYAPLQEEATTLDPHARPVKLLELHECLGVFQVRFQRLEGQAALER